MHIIKQQAKNHYQHLGHLCERNRCLLRILPSLLFACLYQPDVCLSLQCAYQMRNEKVRGDILCVCAKIAVVAVVVVVKHCRKNTKMKADPSQTVDGVYLLRLPLLSSACFFLPTLSLANKSSVSVSPRATQRMARTVFDDMQCDHICRNLATLAKSLFDNSLNLYVAFSKILNLICYSFYAFFVVPKRPNIEKIIPYLKIVLDIMHIVHL